MTASAHRGPAYSCQLSDAPFVDTRFVHVPTPVVPPLDLTRLNDADNARNLQQIPGPVALGRKLLFHDTGASPPEINPMQMHLAATRRGEEHDRLADSATTTNALDDTHLERKQFTKQRNHAPLISSFQDPGLIHPKPPDVPVPRSSGNHGMELKHDSLSARLARLAAGGNSRRVVPVELV